MPESKEDLAKFARKRASYVKKGIVTPKPGELERLTPPLRDTAAPLSSLRPGAQTDASGKLISGTTQTPYNPSQDLARDQAKYTAQYPTRDPMTGLEKTTGPVTGGVDRAPLDNTGGTGVTGGTGGTGDTTQGQGKSIYDLYGMDKTKQPSTDVFSLYGLEQPTKGTVDTSKYDKTIEEYSNPQDNMKQIQEMLNTQMADIQNRYKLERQQTEQQTASEFQSQLSGLYNVGVVNPLSSGTGSIDAASDRILDQRKAALNAQETAEKAKAIADAYDRSSKEEEKILQFAKDERSRLETQTKEKYDYDRQQMSDKVDMINTVVSAWKSGEATDRQQKLDAQAGVMDLIGAFGSGAFDGMDEKVLADTEAATGFPPGSLAKGVAKLKQRELIDSKRKMNPTTFEGSLYDVYRDDNGVIKTDLILKGTPKATGTKTTKAKKQSFEDWLNDSEETNMMSYDISNPDVLKNLVASYEADTGQLKSDLIAKGLKDVKKPETTVEIRNVDGVPMQLVKDKSGKVIQTLPIPGGGQSSEPSLPGPAQPSKGGYTF